MLKCAVNPNMLKCLFGRIFLISTKNKIFLETDSVNPGNSGNENMNLNKGCYHLSVTAIDGLCYSRYISG